MPNATVMSEKQAVVEALTEKLKNAASCVLVDYSGINVANDTALRRDMREAGVDYSVVKNTLLRFAINNAGFEELDPLLNGSTAIAVGSDPIAPAKIVNKYVKQLTNHFSIKGGFVDGKVCSVDELVSIADIPELPVLQAQFLGTMLAPITSLAIVLKAIAEKGGATFEEPAEAPAEA